MTYSCIFVFSCLQQFFICLFFFFFIHCMSRIIYSYSRTTFCLSSCHFWLIFHSFIVSTYFCTQFTVCWFLFSFIHSLFIYWLFLLCLQNSLCEPLQISQPECPDGLCTLPFIYLSIYSLSIFHSFFHFFLNSFCMIDWLIYFFHIFMVCFVFLKYLDPFAYCFVAFHCFLFVVNFLVNLSIFTNCRFLDQSFFVYGILFVNPFRFNRYDSIF